MKKMITIRKAEVNTTPIDIDFDCFQMDGVQVRHTISKARDSSDTRPYLAAMALRKSRAVFCFAITMDAPSSRTPIKELQFLKRMPIVLQGFNLIIHAERSLFSQELVNRHFSNVSFMPEHAVPLEKLFLERTLAKLILGMSDRFNYNSSDMNAFNHAERLSTTTLSDLTSLTNDVIRALNASNHRTT
ncbi:hypothetical protein NHG95_14140 [Pseudomonas corrugata]|uniref:hypothetical protein n=1 Tax=Pseudomonas corrugata TaxID=47879 RepID=UPI0028C48798|nr:hypothetical protein [Pseudomonas corrugata]MDU9034282.1 hypothetical protein [Pseudomonas corrugata]